MSMLYEQTERAASAIRIRCASAPTVAIVLGSGLGALAELLQDPQAIPFGEIPDFPAPTVAGHAGRLIFGALGGHQAAVMQGRFHYYEGHDLARVTLPIRVLAALGAKCLVLTAATGGIRGDLRCGDLVLLSDHINLIGANPLRGVHDERLGARFPDMSEVYSCRLRALAKHAARELGFVLSEAVYAAMPGPSYETPAEIRMLRTLGADVVGMSTIPEAIVARQMGMEVMGLALVTNAAAGLGGAISHEDVLATGRAAEGRLKRLIEAVAAGL